MNSDRLNEYLRIVDLGSIAAAARDLDIPRATLSRRLSELEEQLGVRLLHRSSRSLSMTVAGEELFRRAQRVVAEVEATWEAVQLLDDRPRGPLRVMMPGSPEGTAGFFISFAKEFPDVRLTIATTPNIDEVGRTVDVALHWGEVLTPWLVQKRLWKGKISALASPEYLEQHGTPETVADLSNHRCLGLLEAETGRGRRWPIKGEKSHLTPDWAFASESWTFLMEAVRSGLGIACMEEEGLVGDLKEGRLIRVLPDLVGGESSASLVFLQREYQPPRVRAFVDRASVFFRDWINRWEAPVEPSPDNPNSISTNQK